MHGDEGGLEEVGELGLAPAGQRLLCLSAAAFRLAGAARREQPAQGAFPLPLGGTTLPLFVAREPGDGAGKH